MTETTAPVLTLETPFYVITHYHPEAAMVAPVLLPLEGIGFGLPVFTERDLAEEFVASPNVDVPVAIEKVSLEHLIRTGEGPVAAAKEHDTENECFYMVDPRPDHEWDRVESLGTMWPMQALAEALREELGS